MMFFNVLNFSSRQSGCTMRELFRHRTPVLRTAPRGHFASLRSRSVNRLVVLLLAYSVFQCSKSLFSSERMYYARIVPPSYPRPSDCPRGHFASLRSRSVNRLVVLLLAYSVFQCSKSLFSSERMYYARIVPPSYPRPSDCPRGHFASLRSRSVNRLAVLLLSYDVFQCSKYSFSSERLYHARIVPPSYPRPSDCPQGLFRFPPVAVGKPTTLS